LIFRSIFRKLARYQRKNISSQKFLILATGARIEEAFSFLANLPQPWQVETVISVGTEAEKKEVQTFSHQHGWPVRVETDLELYFSRQYARSLVIALSHEQYHELHAKLENIWNQIPEVVVIPDFRVYQQVPSPLQYIQQVPAFFPHETSLTGVGIVQKRILDLVGSVVALLIFSPLMLLIMVLIKSTSRGPLFYKQERVGLDGHRFQMLKFRSMSVSAEKETGAVWAKKNDSRVTQIGKILRATSLDELPQLLNVLRGEMSLVGPRPERAVFVDQFRNSIPQYMLRHKVKAGMTGWAQINGWRGSTDLQKRIEFDLFYVKNWSLLFDCKILFFTIWKGFVHPNAY
jgi:exopolysaccharide biosynthesis polyprenyl glycosylphosphotransferase